MEYRLDPLAIADLIAAESEQLVFETAWEPHPATRRRMASLGVEVVVNAVSHDVVTECPHGGCGWTFVGTSLRGKAALPRHLDLMHAGRDPRANGTGREALDAMDAGESLADLVIADVDQAPRLTDRQQFALQQLRGAGGEGLHADELGALLCERNGRHPAGTRCVYDGQNGNQILRALRAKGLAGYRRGRGQTPGAWISTTASVQVAKPEPPADHDGPGPVPYNAFPAGY